MQSFLEKTLRNISETLERTLFFAQTSQKPGWLQNIDPRIKLLCGVLMLITISLVTRLTTLFLIYILLVGVALSTQISAELFIKRVWLFLPFFTAIIAIPAIFNLVTPGSTLVTLINWQNPRVFLSITRPGIIVAATLLIRVAASVSTVLLVILTTPWSEVLKSLQILGIPTVFVSILGMTQRYIYVFLHTVNNMFLARKSRVVGKIAVSQNRVWIASTISSLFGKSFYFSEAVYQSMISRGFHDNIKTLSTYQVTGRDWVLLIITASIAFVFIYFLRF